MGDVIWSVWVGAQVQFSQALQVDQTEMLPDGMEWTNPIQTFAVLFFSSLHSNIIGLVETEPQEQAGHTAKFD